MLTLLFTLNRRAYAIKMSMLAAFVTLVMACDPLNPKSKLQPDQGSRLAVAFDANALGDLAREIKSLQIRVFKVQNDKRGLQDGVDHRLAIEPSKKEYTIEQVSLGLKEIEVAVLNANNEALGTGFIRHLVKPGLNVTAPLVIRLIKIESPKTDLPIVLTVDVGVGAQRITTEKAKLIWKTASSTAGSEIELVKVAAGVAQVSYKTDIQAIMDGNCVGCHRGASSALTLELDQFPFKSAMIADQSTLQATLVRRMLDSANPMPPSGLLDSALLEKMKSWQSGGFASDSVTDGSESYKAMLPQLKVAEILTATLVLTGIDGVELYRKEIDPYSIQAGGTLSIAVKLAAAPASLAIPIVVE